MPRPAHLLVVRVTEAPSALPKLHAGPCLVQTGHFPFPVPRPGRLLQNVVCAIYSEKNKEIK